MSPMTLLNIDVMFYMLTYSGPPGLDWLSSSSLSSASWLFDSRSDLSVNSIDFCSIFCVGIFLFITEFDLFWINPLGAVLNLGKP